MNREDIIRMAQELTGVSYPPSMEGVKIVMSHDHLERFAALVAAASARGLENLNKAAEMNGEEL
jgi:hypothetical protein